MKLSTLVGESYAAAIKNPGTVRKFIAALVGGLAEIVALNLVHGTAQGYAVAIVAGATAAGVYQIPNRPQP